MIEDIFHFRERAADRTEQMQEYAGVQRSASCCHRDTVQRREAHAAVPANASAQMLAPLPRCATTILPFAASGARRASSRAMYL